MANLGTQTTNEETGDNVHIARLPNTLQPAPIVVAPSTGGGVSIYTRPA